MGIYFKEEQKKPRWDSGQSILHKENPEPKKQQQERKPYEVKNSYGKLEYRQKSRKPGQQREGFALEALEAAGTPLHTEKEKHIDRASMKKVYHTEQKALFASETPLRSQALFYEISGSKKSSDFLKCMKQLIHQRGHQTLKDAFGFLEQEPEQLELLAQRDMAKGLSPQMKESETAFSPQERETPQSLSLEEFSQRNRRIDTLNSRLLRKQAKERQLCNELQAMLDARTRKERFLGGLKQTLEYQKEQQETNAKHGYDRNRTNLAQPQAEEDGAALESGTEEQDEERNTE